MSVTDGDEPHSPAWNAKFKIVSGDSEGFFSVKTGTNKQEGILSTVKVNVSNTRPATFFRTAEENETLFVVFLPRVWTLRRTASTRC